MNDELKITVQKAREACAEHRKTCTSCGELDDFGTMQLCEAGNALREIYVLAYDAWSPPKHGPIHEFHAWERS